MSDWPLMTVAAAGVIGGLLMLKLPGRQGATGDGQSGNRDAPMGPAIPARSAAPPGCLPVMQFDELVMRAGVAGRLAKIQQKLAFSPENHANDVAPLLQGFAGFVQLLPASESHHHAQPGGLLIHLVEVAEYALHFRDAYKLPIGAITEEQIRLAARYSYAVLVAALLHDIGKPVADLCVQLRDAQGTFTRTWVALAGPMDQQGAHWYSVEFPARRDYEAHQRLAVVLLQRLVPASALTWLGEYRPLLQELMDYLGGDGRQGILAEIIGKADRRSVADNLLTGPRTRFASARAVALIERLMEALRRVLAEGGIALNRAGATAYCDGESLWCVAGTLARTVREYLNRHEQREADAAGIPEDNNRLFDTWQEYGALVPNSAGGAIWNIRVKIGEWEQTFTVLRFALEKLYPSPDRYPQALPAGAIEPQESRESGVVHGTLPSTATASVSVEPVAVRQAGSSAREIHNTGADHQTGPAGYADASVAGMAASSNRPDMNRTPDPAGMDETVAASQRMSGNAAEPEAGAAPVMMPVCEAAAAIGEKARDTPGDTAGEPGEDYPEFDETPLSVTSVVPVPAAHAVRSPAAGVAPVSARARPEFLDDTESAQAELHSQSAAAPAMLQAPVRPRERAASAARRDAASGKPGARPNAERFLAWIQQGIASGTLNYNESKAFVHFVPEGMLVVSPRAFQEYAAACVDAIEIDPGKPLDPWRVVQRDFQRSGWPQKGEGGTYMHYYTVSGPGNSRLVGQLVPEPGRFFDPLPPANVLIQSKVKDHS
ncbi:MobH family relaxase [Paraburkholderia tropica]|uniref:MobH family relaxase n=1 Tax=Paraburkholderia tropica TaxID=92647 RepID=UPI002AB6A264|nr:MobH family relaxase [Paraburkholderia tropica]